MTTTPKIDFVDLVEFVVMDPIHLNKRDNPTYISSVFVFVNRGWNGINNDYSKPQSQQVNDAIVHITDNLDEKIQIVGHGGGYIRFVCGNCGGGLRLTVCESCGAKFHDDGSRVGDPMLMPTKVVAFLKSHGHIFNQDPQIAWEKERKDLNN